MPAAQILFVSGKGGTGKTTIAAALAIHSATRGKRALVVELEGHRTVASLFGKQRLGVQPTPLAEHLHAVRVEPRALLEAYFTRLLRLPFLSRRLFASATFNAVTTAAPGVVEFLILEKLLDWVEPRSLLRRPPYDLVIIDGPATGHAVSLLRAPRQLLGMVPAGPVGSTARRLQRLLADQRNTHVLLVTIPDEMAVNETIEAQATMAGELALHLTRPVLNRVFPQRFTAADSTRIAALSRGKHDEPLLVAARLQISARHDATRHASRLRRVFGTSPVTVPHFFTEEIRHRELERIGATLGRAILDER